MATHFQKDRTLRSAPERESVVMLLLPFIGTLMLAFAVVALAGVLLHLAIEPVISLIPFSRGAG